MAGGAGGGVGAPGPPRPLAARRLLDRYYRVCFERNDGPGLFSGARGRISAGLLREELREELSDGGATAAVCGPSAFTDLAQQLLAAHGLSSDRIILFKG